MKALPDKIELAAFLESWPRDASGMKAHHLMLDFLGTLLIDSALGASAKRNRAQAEMGAHKAVAKIITDLRRITAEKKEVKKISTMKSLSRFQTEPAKPTKPDPQK